MTDREPGGVVSPDPPFPDPPFKDRNPHTEPHTGRSARREINQREAIQVTVPRLDNADRSRGGNAAAGLLP